MSWPPLPATALVFELFGETVLLNQSTGDLVALDEAGAALLNERGNLRSMDDAAALLVQQLGHDRLDAERGLLQFTSALAEAMHQAPDRVSIRDIGGRATQPPISGSPPARWRVDALGVGLEIVCHDAELARILGPLLASLPPSSSKESEIAAWMEGEHWTVTLDGNIICENARLEHAASQVFTILTASAIAHPPREGVLVHSACVVLGDRAILLGGHSNQGKSSTAIELLQHGSNYLTDEVTNVDLTSGRVTGLARPIALEGRTCAQYPKLRPAWIPASNTYPRWLISPGDLAGVTQSGTLDAAVFLEFDAESNPPSMTSLAPLETVARLCQLMFHPEVLTEERVREIARAIEHIPSVVVRHHGSANAAQAILTWMQQWHR